MKLKTYFSDVYNELMFKVSWPTWKELQSSAMVVMVASLIIAIIVAVMDAGFRNMMEAIYRILY